MTTKGARQIAAVLAMQVAAEGIPVLTKIDSDGTIRVIVGDSATKVEFDRADELAVAAEQAYGIKTIVVQ